MKRWKAKLVITGILCVLLAIFVFIRHQRIVATSPDPSAVGARDDSLAQACGMILGVGLVLIWAYPFLHKLGNSLAGRKTDT